MRTQTSKKSWARRGLLAIGVSFGLLVAPVLGPWQSQAQAEKSIVIDSVCSLLGEVAWNAYFAKNYKLVDEVDKAMTAIGCFEN